jgi:hypothetical protein
MTLCGSSNSVRCLCGNAALWIHFSHQPTNFIRFFDAMFTAFSRWFGTQEVDDFAKLLAREFAKRYPPNAAADLGAGAKPPSKLINALDDTIARAVKFRKAQKLGVYRKAKFGNTFKWELRELGYSEAFVERITKELVFRLAAK